jgi:hypothetical protein
MDRLQSISSRGAMYSSCPRGILRRLVEIARRLKITEPPAMPRITRRRPLDGKA